jgi:hypothetical protein
MHAERTFGKPMQVLGGGLDRRSIRQHSSRCNHPAPHAIEYRLVHRFSHAEVVGVDDDSRGHHGRSEKDQELIDLAGFDDCRNQLTFPGATGTAFQVDGEEAG